MYIKIPVAKHHIQYIEQPDDIDELYKIHKTYIDNDPYYKQIVQLHLIK